MAAAGRKFRLSGEGEWQLASDGRKVGESAGVTVAGRILATTITKTTAVLAMMRLKCHSQEPLLSNSKYVIEPEMNHRTLYNHYHHNFSHHHNHHNFHRRRSEGREMSFSKASAIEVRG